MVPALPHNLPPNPPNSPNSPSTANNFPCTRDSSPGDKKEEPKAFLKARARTPQRAENSNEVPEKSLRELQDELKTNIVETSDFAYFFEEEHLAWLIAVNTNAGRVITAVLLSREAVGQYLADGLAILGEIIGQTANQMTKLGSSTRGEHGASMNVHTEAIQVLWPYR